MVSISDPYSGSLADLYAAMGVPYQMYDNPGIYNQDDAYVRPGMFGDQVPVFDGQTFKLMNGKEALYEGAGYEGLQEAARLSQDLGSGWRLLSSVPTQDRDAGVLNQMFADGGKAGIGYGGRAKTDWDNKMLLGALPFAAALAAPAIGGMLGAGGSGAAGAGAAGSTAGVAGTAGAAGAAGAGGLGAGAIGAALPAFEGITVLGGVGGGLGAGTAAGLAGAGALGGLAVSNLGQATAGAQPSGTNYGQQAYNPNAEIVVNAPTAPPVDVLGQLGPPLAITGATGALATGAGSVTQPGAQQPQSTTDKIINAMKAAGLLTGVLGNAVAGGGSGGATIPHGAGQPLNPIFTDDLPAANIPGVGDPANLAARNMPAQDWTRYAMRPEQSFFNYVPEGYSPPAPETLDPEWDQARNFAVGGMVKGGGSGRADKVPANLSDGEYVVDAETVALLGDGSNQAGAHALDSFRANIRKHKGRDLVKGQFSVKAKKPAKYLKDRK